MNQPESNDRHDLQEWIDQVADRFEQEWKKAANPSIAGFLANSSGQSRIELLHELVRIDLQHKVQINGPIDLNQYVAEFPELIVGEGQLPDDLVLFADQLSSQNSSGPSTEDSASRTLRGIIQADENSLPELPVSLGHFQLLEFLGGGSFATVFKARDCELQRTVAIKIPRPGMIENKNDSFRFLQEARTVSRLRHPNIVPLHEVSRVDSTPFLVTDFVQGQTLEELMEGNTPEVRSAAEMVRNIALALHHAHSNHVVHRDIKPSNILIDEAGRPMVVDFGLAAQLDSHIKKTMDGQILGTPAYMSPEQASGQSVVDARSDIYSLGVVMYEMLSGERPFGGNIRMILHQVINDEPRSIRRLNDSVPRDLEVICLKCLSKSKSQRYESAEGLASDLDRFLKGEPISARPVSALEKLWRWSQRKPALAVSLLVIALLLMGTSIGATLAAVNFGQLAAKEKDTRLAEQRATQSARQELSRSLAANGILRILNDDVGGLHDLLDSVNVESLSANEKTSRLRLTNAWADEMDGSLVNILGGRSQVRFAKFCNEGKWIAMATQDCCFQLWDAKSGLPLTEEIPHNPKPAFLSELFVVPGNLRVVSADQTGLIRFWTIKDGNLVDEIQADSSVDGVCVSPDRKLIAYPVTSNGNTKIRIETTNRTGVVAESPVPFAVNRLKFSPFAKRLALTGNRGELIIYDCVAKKIVWQIRAHGKVVTDLDFDKSGSRLITSSFDDTVKVWDLDQRKIIGDPLKHDEDVKAVAFSPTKDLVASAGYDSTVYLWNPTDSRPLVRKLIHDGPVISLAFDSTGKFLVTGGLDTQVRVWDTGTGIQVNRLMQHQSSITKTSFHPSQPTVLSSSNDKTARLWDLNNQTKSIEKLDCPDRIWSVDFSQGSDVLCVATEQKNFWVWEFSNETRKKTSLEHTGTGIATRFSPDGKTLATIDQRRIRLWDQTSGFEKFRQLEFEATYRHVEFGPGGDKIIAGTDQGFAVLFDLQEENEQPRILQHPSAVCGVAFDPEGKFLITGCKDGRIRVWDPDTAELIKLPITLRESVESLCISPDGKFLATASGDLSVRIWTTSDWKPYKYIIRNPSFVQAMAFDHSSNLLATADNNGKVQIWDVMTALPCGMPIQLNLIATSVRFSPDGRYLATGGFDQTLRLWTLPFWFHKVDERTTQLRVRKVLGSSRDQNGTEKSVSWKEWQRIIKPVPSQREND